MDKLQIIERIIKYLPLPAFVVHEGNIILKNELGEKIELNDVSDRLSSVSADGGALMWDDRIGGESCTLVAWRVEEYCLLTVNHINPGISGAVVRITRGIRQPLGSVHACTKILLNRLEDEDETTDTYAATITQNIYRLMRLISNLDAFSNFEEYNLDTKCRATDMVMLVREMVEEIDVYAGALGKSVSCRFSSLPIVAMVDTELIGLALGNLITNSIKYSQAGARVTVKLELAGKNVVITVSDTGDGISPEKLQQIAGMNFSWENISDMLSASAGIGIPIARLTAIVHGGSLMIESREGIGTNVVMTFPFVKSDDMFLNTKRSDFRPEFLSPLVLLADILPDECYMFHEL